MSKFAVVGAVVLFYSVLQMSICVQAEEITMASEREALAEAVNQAKRRNFPRTLHLLESFRDIEPETAEQHLGQTFYWMFCGHHRKALASFEKGLEHSPEEMAAIFLPLSIDLGDHWISSEDDIFPESWEELSRQLATGEPQASNLFNRVEIIIEDAFQYPFPLDRRLRCLALLDMTVIRSRDGKDVLKARWTELNYRLWKSIDGKTTSDWDAIRTADAHLAWITLLGGEYKPTGEIVFELILAERPEEAQIWLDRVVTQDGWNGTTHGYQSMIWEAQGKYPEALAAKRKEREFYQQQGESAGFDSEDSLDCIAQLAFAAGDYRFADELCTERLESLVANQDFWDFSQIRKLRSHARRKLGNVDAAEADLVLDEAWDLTPEQTLLWHDSIVRHRIELGQFDRAMDAMENGLDADLPDAVRELHRHKRLWWFHRKKGNRDLEREHEIQFYRLDDRLNPQIPSIQEDNRVERMDLEESARE